ncbi:hypothetical protein [Marinicauda pacifica]|nr:hypothetical protein [Marinicauda pacifica]
MAQDKQREGPDGPSVSDIAVAFGAEGPLRRFFGTLFASVVTPNTVLRDAFENGSRFISPFAGLRDPDRRRAGVDDISGCSNELCA